ncbi:Mlp family lipoprotein [Borrelia duttonii]|uniref:Family 113-like protein, lipoprotein n=1 Tax=Borrelia duttonii (strain Ly) TaxID=412419 RepID=B5RP52_BORDL|nr:family 113-like protein, lipoprotein [Borrelia duttonii Ly]
MYKYLKQVLIYSLILIYSCTDKVKEPTNTQQANYNKNFNTIINGFNKYIEKAREDLNKHEKDKRQLQNYDDYKIAIDKYDKFISWIEDNPDTKKKLDTDFTEAYNCLEQRRAENAPEKTLDEYIRDAIDCTNNPLSCKDTRKKYGTKNNQIFLFFTYNFHTLFHSKNTLKDILVKFKTLDISEVKDKF